MSKLGLVVGIIAILAGSVLYSGILSDKHSILQIYPDGQQLAPNFRGIEGLYFQNKEKLFIHYRQWPVKNPNALVFCLHGTLDHSGWYEDYANILNQKGFSVFVLDHQGHGLSEGDMGHVQSFDRFRDDVIQFINLIKEKNSKKLPIFLLAESLGTIMALDVAINQPKLVDSVVVIGAPIDFPSDFPEFLRSFVDQMSIYVPKMKVIPLHPDPHLHFTLQEVLNKWENDPLVFRGFATPRFVSSAFSKIKELRNSFHKMTQPLFIVQGDKDIPSQHRGSKILYDSAGSQIKFLTTYDDLKHYPLQDVQHNSKTLTETQADILNFFETSLKNK